MSSAPLLQQVAEAVEDFEPLDAVASVLREIAEALTASDTVGRALTGEALGVALHPALVHLPLGAAASAAVVDLLGAEHDRAAGVLTGLAVLTGVPSAVAGLADYARQFGSRSRRLGAAHMVLTASGTKLAAASWLARSLGGRTPARALLGAALVAYAAGGMLGGHLAHVVSDDPPAV